MFKKYKPSRLKGRFEKNKYFEGWFQKIYSRNQNASFIIIYGYATGNSYNNFGFLQVLIPGKPAEIVYFSKDEIACDADKHVFQLGNNRFTFDLIQIQMKDLDIHLKLESKNTIQTFKNSMGYSYILPNLPCYHSVLNTSHFVSGEIQYMQTQYSLDNEFGYLEKNWGTSFPESYFWLHAVDPKNPSVSLLMSQAEIKWIGKKFIKHVGHFRFDGLHIDLRELKKGIISTQQINKEQSIINLSSKVIQLEILITKGNKILLKGPNDGNLLIDIPHHTDALMEVCLSQNNKTRRFQLVGNFESIGRL